MASMRNGTTHPNAAPGKRGFRILAALLIAASILGLLFVASSVYGSNRKALSDVFGVNRSEIVAWLSSHEQDGYYLGTPYRPYDWRSPNGDINGWGANSDGKSAGMNCTGFVWHALCAAHGWRDDIANRLPAMKGWASAIRDNDLETYTFDTKEALLGSGVLEKGDIIWMWQNGNPNISSDFHHVGIFWGNSPSEDLMWHSDGDASNNWSGMNHITAIHGKAPSVAYQVVKPGGPLYGAIDLQKTSGSPSITEGNPEYSLAGAVYGIFTDAGCTQQKTQITTDSAGYGIAERLEPATYYVKELTAPRGFELDPNVYPTAVGPGATTRVNGDAVTDTAKLGRIELRKVSSRPAITDRNDNYALDGAVFGIFRDQGCTQEAGRFSTSMDQGAYGLSDPLPGGRYYVKELTPPKGYDLNSQVFPVDVVPGTTAAVNGGEVKDPPKPAYIDLQKVSAEPDVTEENQEYSLEGAIYGIFTEATCKNEAGRLTTDRDGYAKPQEVAAGIYFVKELKAPPGYKLDPNVYKVSPTPGQTARVGSPRVADAPLKGWIDLKKVSSNTGATDGNGSYSTARASYGIYRDSACKDEKVQIVTDGNSYAKSDALPLGTYFVREKTPSPGFALDPTIYKVRVVAEETVRVNTATVSEPYKNAAVELLLAKTDKETGEPSAQGATSLAGAQFTFDYYKGLYDSAEQAQASGSPARTWIMETGKDGRITLDEAHRVNQEPFYRNSQGAPCLPLGTLLIRETKAPEGYLPDGTVHKVRIDDDGGTDEELGTYNAPTHPNQVSRGDLSFVKIRESNQARLSGIPFRITSKTTGESHILVTDANGHGNTSAAWVPHSCKTNGNDDAVKEDGTVDEGKLDAQAGLWFGRDSQGRATVPDDSKGALPYDTYRLEELPVSKNAGLKLITVEAVVSRDGYGIDMGVLTDGDLKERPPAIATEARSQTGGEKVVYAVPQATVIDRVTWTDLDATDGHSYTLHGVLMDREANTPVVDGEGTAAEAYRTFTPQSASGFTELALTFDGTRYSGRDLVVFEEVIDNEDGKVVASHKDLDDYKQTVRVVAPQIATAAFHESDETKELPLSDGASLVDRVAYRNLQPGREYRLTGTVQLLDEEGTAKPLAVGGELSLKSSIAFTPENPEGTVEVPFKVDTLLLAGRRLVIFEQLCCDGCLVAAHEDPADEAQTVRVAPPQMKTYASDGKDGDKTVSADGSASIKDAVTLEGLAPGEPYSLVGTLHLLGEDGAAEALTDGEGKPRSATVDFQPESASATVDVTIDFDGAGLGGRSLVVFEDLRRDGLSIASHQDPADNDQIVTMEAPALRTRAADGSDGDQMVPVDKEAVIVDTVAFKGLTAQATYRLEGSLNLIGEDGTVQPLTDGEGAPYTVNRELVPEAPEGTAEVTFTVDTLALGGKNLVVFERLYREESLIASHEDPHDQEQTVAVRPLEVTSLASNGRFGSNTVTADGEALIHDTFSLANATSGHTYTAHAILIDPDTGLPVIPRSSKEAIADEELRDYMAAYGRAAGFFDGRVAVLSAEGPNGEGPTLLDEYEHKPVYPVPYDEAAIEALNEKYPRIAKAVITSTNTAVAEGGFAKAEIDYALDARELEGTRAISMAVMADEYGNVSGGETDIGNERQTVGFTAPRITTAAKDAEDGNQIILTEGAARIIDEVNYENLTPGVEYTLEGVLYDKASQKPALQDGKPLKARSSFVAHTPKGTAEVAFDVDATALAGKQLVVFEELSRDVETKPGASEKIVVAAHEDIECAEQTVYIVDDEPETPVAAPPSTPTPKTGDGAPLLPLIAALAATAAVVLGLGIRNHLTRRRRQRHRLALERLWRQ